MLEALANRYPEKTLYLGQVFNDTANSYKLVWFLAILSLLQRPRAPNPLLAEILAEMATIAWHPVCLYRLTLGRQDKLQHVVLAIQRASKLPPDATAEDVRKFVAISAVAQAQMDAFRRYVPTRFLSPWFADRLRGEKDFRRDRLIVQLAKKSQTTPLPSLYWLDGNRVCLSDSWRAFLLDNIAVVQAFAEYHFAQYLQTRNPNVPGVITKMRAPTQRQLASARRFWRFLRNDLGKSGETQHFTDIYSGAPLGEDFSIDHFLPWSFVVHDLLWNLAPVESTTNSKKGDALPDLKLYLPKLAKMHFRAIEATRARPKELQDHTDCFKVDAAGLVALGEEGLLAKYREVIEPQTQIAINQGFHSAWVYKN